MAWGGLAAQLGQCRIALVCLLHALFGSGGLSWLRHSTPHSLIACPNAPPPIPPSALQPGRRRQPGV